jgi:hypothetical protein
LKNFQVLNQTSQNNQRGQNSKLICFPFLPINLGWAKMNR